MVELLDLVNERDEVIGTCSRDDQGKPHVITRNVVVYLRDSAGMYVVQVRAKTKSRWPGCFDFAACGSVKAGETYLAGAQRELEEELGVRCELHLLHKEYREVPHNGTIMRLHTVYFHGVYDGTFAKTPEVDAVLKLSHGQIDNFIAAKDKRVQPYFVEEWDVLCACLSRL
ncbi:NUDIX domain-containing protein [Candidatus Woesearchaeota archaeon]|nr:MAG: NUDIX domain-containing protein [Candidatus Woesearchaeota archaeon]